VRKLFSVPLGEGCGISCPGCAIAISELGFLVVVRVIRIGRCGYGVLVGGAMIVGFVICVIGVKAVIGDHGPLSNSNWSLQWMIASSGMVESSCYCLLVMLKFGFVC
jgi:hypothetical protein